KERHIGLGVEADQARIRKELARPSAVRFAEAVDDVVVYILLRHVKRRAFVASHGSHIPDEGVVLVRASCGRVDMKVAEEADRRRGCVAVGGRGEWERAADRA